MRNHIFRCLSIMGLSWLMLAIAACGNGAPPPAVTTAATTAATLPVPAANTPGPSVAATLPPAVSAAPTSVVTATPAATTASPNPTGSAQLRTDTFQFAGILSEDDTDPLLQAIRSLPGVTDVEAGAQEMQVTYDPTKVNREQIIALAEGHGIHLKP